MTRKGETFVAILVNKRKRHNLIFVYALARVPPRKATTSHKRQREEGRFWEATSLPRRRRAAALRPDLRGQSDDIARKTARIGIDRRGDGGACGEDRDSAEHYKIAPRRDNQAGTNW